MAERTILETIVERRREDLLYAREALPLPRLAAMAKDAPPAIDFVARLRASGPMALIGEIKRASPSKGDIAPGIDAAEQALRYAPSGVTAAFSDMF